MRPDSRYLGEFLRFYADDIRRFQPGFSGDVRAADMAMFILRDMVPAGLFLGRGAAPGVLEVDLDYVTPRYRDFKTARFLYDHNRDEFRRHGYTTLRARADTAAHRAYLRKVGFAPVAGDRFELRVAS